MHSDNTSSLDQVHSRHTGWLNIKILISIVIKGENLRLGQFDTQKGDVTGEGSIHALIYTALENNQGFFSRIFK